jgi:hypothetical protein
LPVRDLDESKERNPARSGVSSFRFFGTVRAMARVT